LVDLLDALSGAVSRIWGVLDPLGFPFWRPREVLGGAVLAKLTRQGGFLPWDCNPLVKQAKTTPFSGFSGAPFLGIEENPAFGGSFLTPN